jgi:hypothetical protein
MELFWVFKIKQYANGLEEMQLVWKTKVCTITLSSISLNLSSELEQELEQKKLQPISYINLPQLSMKYMKQQFIPDWKFNPQLE